LTTEQREKLNQALREEVQNEIEALVKLHGRAVLNPKSILRAQETGMNANILNSKILNLQAQQAEFGV
jgi:hypothetical protein